MICVSFRRSLLIVIVHILSTHNVVVQKEKRIVTIGRIGSLQINNKEVEVAKTGDEVCVKIEQNLDQDHIAYGRHFSHKDKLYSKLTRKSIDILKRDYKTELKRPDWELVIRFKSMFGIL